MNRKKKEKFKKKPDLPTSQIDEDIEYFDFKKKYQLLKDRYKISPAEFLAKLEEKEILIPNCIFNIKNSTFESIVKYLRENLGFGNKGIASLINKSEKSIWQAYNSAIRKYPSKFKIKTSKYYIPVSTLKKYTILEAIVKYLREHLNLRYHEIALILKRNDRTIWTVYNRFKRK